MKILVDHGSTGNLGDTAMLESVVARLREIVPNPTLTVRRRPGMQTNLWGWNDVQSTTLEVSSTIDNPPSMQRIPFFWRYEEQWQTTWSNGCQALLGRLIDARHLSLQGNDTRVSLDAFCQQFDGLHIVGGGNLTDAFASETWQRCCLIHTFAAQEKPVILTGQQIGPFRNRWTRDAVRRALGRAEFVGLRESTDSLDFCKEANLPLDRYIVMGDDSFGLPASASEQTDAVLARYRLQPHRFIALNLRMANYVPADERSLRHLSTLASALARRYDMPLLVVPIELGTDSDIVAGQKLRGLCGGRGVQVLDEPQLTSGLVKGVLGKAYAAVGTSYHFCIFALSQGVPAVCTFNGDYYSQKARGLARFWDDERLALPLDENYSDASMTRTTSLLEDDDFRTALYERARSALDKWRDVFDRAVQTHLLRFKQRVSPLTLSMTW
jgi:polysaccharide pyruvyl transferase WcaK-like protein